MLKKISYLVVFLISVVINYNVFAAKYTDQFDEHGMWISNEFVSKAKNGTVKYQQMTLIVKKSDNQFVYCIEPGKSLNENNVMKGYDVDQHIHANLSLQQWDRIKLLAYYGYGYKNHTDIKWYVITQFMIWQTNNLGYDIYFTDKLNGNRIEKYTSEMMELDNLVNSHYKIPKFNVKTLNLFWNEEKSFVDSNNVLNNYNITSGPNIEVSKNENTLTVKSKNYGRSYITFLKSEKRFSNKPVVYIDGINQNLLSPGKLDNVSDIIIINMDYGKINVNKLDYDTKTNNFAHQGSLENAKYGLYKNSGEFLEEQYTSKEGYLRFNTKLETGNYYVQEITPSEGYQLDDTKYYFDINKDNYIVTLNVYEKVIKENFEIIKVLENTNSGQLQFEKGIEFGVYDINNNLIKTYTTSDFGTINFSLPYGKYTLKQHNSYDGYEKIKDYEINVLENNKNNKLVFKDNLIKYRVKLNVKNKTTHENIEKIEFELLDKENKKICYVINYPSERKICKYSTDKNGEIFFPQNFKFDDYTIKLIYDENFEYIFDEEKINLSINKDTKYKQLKDYRLIELNYFLDLEKKEPEIPLENNDQNKNEIPITTEKIETEKLDTEKLENKELENEEIKLEDDNSNIEEGIIVEVPNTLKNTNYNLLICMLSLLIIKKLFYLVIK